MISPDWTQVQPGTVTDLQLTPDLGSGEPIACRLIRGARPGPTLLVTAGVHGAEYASIEAATRLMATDPQTLGGMLVVLPIVNPPAFSARSIYINPLDGKNLNRCFPGRPDGTYAERLAHWLTSEFIAHADAFLDLHGGDLVEALAPFCIVPAGDEAAMTLGRVFGLPHLTVSEGQVMSISAARQQGVPAVIAEAGGQGLWPEQAVAPLVDGVVRVMRHLKMLDGTSGPLPVQEYHALAWMSAPVSGLWTPAVQVGETVEAGQPVGHIRDVFGTVLAELSAPAGGTVLFAVTSLAMNAGDPLYGIGTLSSEAPHV
ncbi:M14 family metallopeptidase [Deinococcus sonorensis]|uniref:M14 family metallopeptidase n=2 Tax=Deinococcus sonorensis TaxID=309891 RepID=A0AAU7U4R1_9DEIO